MNLLTENCDGVMSCTTLAMMSIRVLFVHTGFSILELFRGGASINPAIGFGLMSD